MGYTDHELDHKPIIGIANTWNTLVPGHFNLNQVSEFVKKGVYSAGGTVVEFGVIGALSLIHISNALHSLFFCLFFV